MVGGLLLATMAPLAASAELIKICNGRFPDPIFMEYVKTFDTDGNGYLSDSERAAVIKIDVSDKGVRSLCGMQYFPNLNTLDCTNNMIGDLNFSKNTKIKSIWCSKNKISGTALRKMVASLPDRKSESEKGHIYFRLTTERENKGMNTSSFPYDKVNAIGWEGYEYSTNHWLKIGSNSIENVPISSTRFPDDNFRNYLLSQSYGADGTLTESEKDALTDLDVSSKGIKSLKGIEWLTGLKNLQCGDNELTSLDLSYNAYLSYVICSRNRIFGTEMETLVESLPAPPVSVWIGQTDDVGLASSLWPFSGESVEGNTMTSSQTTTCTNKYWAVFLDNTAVNGEEIPLYINPVTFPDATFRNFISSQSYGQDGKITAAEIATITSLSTENSSVASVAGIEYFSALKNLTLYGQTNMTAIDIHRNTNLEKLQCQANKIETIDLSANTKLKTLNVGETLISSIDFTPVKNTLEVFKCSSSKFTTLSLSSLTKLKQLNCVNCQLNSLDVSTNTNLQFLDCGYNNLSSLNLTKNTSLISLDCSYNNFNSLTLTANTQLTSLYCNGNQLTGLNLTKNTVLEELYCPNNKLTSLTLPNTTTLKSIYIYENQFNLEAMGNIRNTLLNAGNTNAKICLYNNTLGREGNLLNEGLLFSFTGNNVSARLSHVGSGEKYYDPANYLAPQDNNVCYAGSLYSLPIKLQNSNTYKGFSFDLVLPDGITLSEVTATGRLSSQEVSFTKDAIHSGVYHVTVSPTAAITGSSGAVLNLMLNVMKSMEDNIRLQNIVLRTGSSGTGTSAGPLTASITVVNNSEPGDVNGRDGVTPADAIMVLYHYFGVQQLGFNMDAADMNGDKQITPADAIEALYKYFGANGARATKPASPTATEDLDPE